MNNDLLPFLKTFNQLFYIDMDLQTSACLFGSAATNDWVSTRSDLDLFIFIPESRVELFSKKIKEWQSMPKYPLLDGIVMFSSGNVLMAKRLYDFDKAAQPVAESIWLIDLWNIKNRSKHLFGNDLTTFIRDMGQEELREWAIKNIKDFWIPIISDGLSLGDESSEVKIPLSSLVWTARGVARMLMLTQGNICSSKREALVWFADKFPEIRETINLLREDFEKPDDMAMALNAKQTFKLGRFYLHLLREVKR